MGEVVSLQQYRAALAIIAARRKTSRWDGMHFREVAPFEYFRFPSWTEPDLIFLKVDRNAACPWGTSQSAHGWWCGVGLEVFMFSDMPVVLCAPENVPPG